jgi:hypothetical protein
MTQSEPEDLASDERWNDGVNYAITQLCSILGVDPKSISWDAATETLDGDVSSVICNAIRGAYGDEWSSKPETTARILAALTHPPAAQPPDDVREAARYVTRNDTVVELSIKSAQAGLWASEAHPGMTWGRDGLLVPGSHGLGKEWDLVARVVALSSPTPPDDVAAPALRRNRRRLYQPRVPVDTGSGQ